MTVSNVNVSAATLGTYIYTATGGETSKSGPDDNGATLSYTPGKELVHVNGVLLVKTSDYTATDGSSITLVNALVAGDVLEVISFSPFSVANAIPSTVVTAKGDLIAASSSGTVTNLAVGADGTTLVANSSASTGVSWATPVASLANPVINGGFDIWQRGTSINSSTDQYTADRWYLRMGASCTIARYATSDTTNLPNIQYCARVQRNSGSTSTTNVVFSQPMESVNSIPFAGKTVTYSFYARKGANFSEAASKINVYLISGTGTDQNYASGYTGTAFPIASSATLTATWQRFTYTGTVAATATELTAYVDFTPVGTALGNDYFEITGVQIDLGTYNATTAPAFRRSGGTLQGETSACQRYYYRQTVSTNYGQYCIAWLSTATGPVGLVTFPVTMRVAPTALESSNLSFRDYANTHFAASSVTLDTPTTTSVGAFYATITGGTAGRVGVFEANNTTSSYLGWTAEL